MALIQKSAKEARFIGTLIYNPSIASHLLHKSGDFGSLCTSSCSKSMTHPNGDYFLCLSHSFSLQSVFFANMNFFMVREDAIGWLILQQIRHPTSSTLPPLNRPHSPRLPIPGPVFSISSPHITHVMVILQILKGTLKNMLIISQGYIFNRNKKIPTGETSSLPCCLFVTRLEQCTVLI